jgi:hypothetical protein
LGSRHSTSDPSTTTTIILKFAKPVQLLAIVDTDAAKAILERSKAVMSKK